MQSTDRTDCLEDLPSILFNETIQFALDEGSTPLDDTSHPTTPSNPQEKPSDLLTKRKASSRPTTQDPTTSHPPTDPDDPILKRFKTLKAELQKNMLSDPDLRKEVQYFMWFHDFINSQ